jgi:hypothetical protein
MEKYEYLVVTTDGKSHRIVADSIKGVLAAVDEDETPIANIFRNVSISEGTVSEPATVSAKVLPAVAYATGCRAFPVLPVDTVQGKTIVLSAVTANGWKFSGWYTPDGKVISTELQATVLVEKAGENMYEARFYTAV